MAEVRPAPDFLYNISILLNGMVRTFPIHIDKKSLMCPIADIERIFKEQTGDKHVRVMQLTKVKEIITIE